MKPSRHEATIFHTGHFNISTDRCISQNLLECAAIALLAVKLL